MISSISGWLPIDGAPVGLVTWYAPAGPAVAVLTSWLAVVNGRPPALRAGCSGRMLAGRPFPEGTDFAVNVPADMECQVLHELLRSRPEDSPLLVAEHCLLPARAAHAPLIADCTLQIECARGRLLPGAWEPELAGDILLLTRGGSSLAPADYPDFCDLAPLRAIPPA